MELSIQRVTHQRAEDETVDAKTGVAPWPIKLVLARNSND